MKNKNPIIAISFFLLISLTPFLKAQNISGNTFASNNILNDVYAIDANNIIVAGSGGIVLKTQNAGSNWSSNIIHPSYDLRGIQFLNDNTGWMHSNFTGPILKTTDAGASWDIVTQTGGPFYFIDENTGWTAYSNSGIEIRILKTSNGGADWVSQFTLPDNFYPNSVYMSNIGVGYVLCFNNVNDSKIIKTTNGGSEWIVQPLINYSLYTFDFINSNTGWTAGISGSVLITTNVGNSWVNQVTGTDVYLRSIDFINENTGWSCGEGIIIKTINGGVNWFDQINIPLLNLSSVNSFDENNIWAAGNLDTSSAGVIYKSTNGGINWVKVYDKTVSVEIISSLIPDKFSLSQNYPNPFNPVTKLEFGISKLEFVTLKVYDGLGREIATLVNETLTPGTYNYQFSIINYQLASGVYFYRLKAGSFVETKRMILLK